MNRFTCFLIVLFGGIFSMYSQTFQVQGKVSDDQNISLIGVNVLVKNEARGTTTDFDGNYSLNVSPNETLIFSYVGYVVKEVSIDRYPRGLHHL